MRTLAKALEPRSTRADRALTFVSPGQTETPAAGSRAPSRDLARSNGSCGRGGRRTTGNGQREADLPAAAMQHEDGGVEALSMANLFLSRTREGERGGQRGRRVGEEGREEGEGHEGESGLVVEVAGGGIGRSSCEVRSLLAGELERSGPCAHWQRGRRQLVRSPAA